MAITEGKCILVTCLWVAQGMLHQLSDVCKHSLNAAQIAVVYRSRLCIEEKLSER